MIFETITDATGTRSFDYDPATLQLTAENLDSTFYDGLVLTRQYEDGNETHGLKGRTSGYDLLAGGTTSVASAAYSYTEQGRLHTITDGTDSFTYAYKNNSNLLASMEGPVHAVSYSYEPNRDLMSSIDNKAGNQSGSTLSKYQYIHDALNRRTDRTQSGSAIATTNTDTFAYNPRSEVIASENDIATAAVWNPSYTYDPIGNRLTSTGFIEASYITNELNQYTELSVSAPPREPGHDKDGNLIDNGDGWTYSWNAENRLVQATNGTITIDFTYDYQGRLVKKDDGTDVKVYVYDDWNRIFEISNPASQIETTKSFLWGLDLSGSMQGAGGVGGLLKEGDLYPLFDANGNIMQKLDQNGAVVMSVTYDPFGNVIDGTLAGDFGFSTKPLIDDLNWYYYGFRYYDPETGRWLNRDPIGEEGGLNLYAFVYNDAVNWWDFLGLEIQYFSHQHSPGPMQTVGQTDSHLGGGSSRQQGMSNISNDISTGKSIVSRIQDLNNITRGKSLTNIGVDRMKQFGKGLLKSPATPMFWWSNWFEPAIEDLTGAPVCGYWRKGQRISRKEQGRCALFCAECPGQVFGQRYRGQVERYIVRECDGFQWRIVSEVVGDCSVSCPDSHPHKLAQRNSW